MEKPAFVYLATNPPHGPFDDVPNDLLKKYQGKDLASTLAPGIAAKQKEKHLDTTARV